MKKSLIFFAGLALMAAGCAKTEVVTSGPEGAQKGINFAAYASRTTKAAQVDVTTGNLTSFQASAIGNDAVYFDNVTFTKGTVWTSNPVYFWPAYNLDFYAYNTPASGNGTLTPSIAVGGQTLFYTPSTDLAKQEDLVAAYAGSQNEGNATSTEGSLAITFHHYLTQVIVNALSTNSNYTVVVDGVKLANLAGDGTYNFSLNTMTATAEKVNSATSSDYDEEFTAKTLTDASQEVMSDAGGSKWYLIPQTVTSWDQVNNKTNDTYGTYLALKVKITAKNGFKVYPRTGDESAWMAVPVPATLAFAKGVKYNVTVKFFGEAGEGGAGYVDPEVPGDLDGDGDSDDDKGQKILGGAIKFNATVDEWGTAVDVTISL